MIPWFCELGIPKISRMDNITKAYEQLLNTSFSRKILLSPFRKWGGSLEAFPCSSELWEQIYRGKGRPKLSETKHPLRNSSRWRMWTTQMSTKFSVELEVVCSKRGKKNKSFSEEILSLGSPVLFPKKAKALQRMLWFSSQLIPCQEWWLGAVAKSSRGDVSSEIPGVALASHCCWTSRGKAAGRPKRSWCPCPGLVLLSWPGFP